MPKLWPWARAVDVRAQAQNATDVVVEAILARAQHGDPDLSGVGAYRAAVQLWTRSFASGEPAPANARTASLTPMLLGMLGSELARKGEAVLLLDNGTFLPASTWTIAGGTSPATWLYTLQLIGPSSSRPIVATASQVAHVRINAEASTPYKGRPPLDSSASLARLASAMEATLADDLNQPHGSYFLIPTNTPLDTATELKGKLANAKGGMVLVPGLGKLEKPERYGPTPPEALVTLRQNIAHDVLACYGVPPDLATGASAANSRESYRRFVAATINPVAAVASAEIGRVLGVPDFKLSFAALAAADIAAKARAYGVLVNAGMDEREAAAVVGLD